ncbi:hypothetical protein CROQUDRAFT_92265 [Cronartium quercuum f. sp. fusiforme G11]|uniref:Uncharacterized protein n=1 Tax=Cronartium quercuum f. sp. fusiforme G11 TaxID=708437 RepID=A0A9P6TBZ0_9BASI|nr:hypothetical protein CROQUDRAFT_92265 [Cronartium quercuum f. sp. fusiforme G11]
MHSNPAGNLLSKYHDRNDVLPKRIIFYRDGAGASLSLTNANSTAPWVREPVCIAATDYADGRKLLFIVCDGMITEVSH